MNHRRTILLLTPWNERAKILGMTSTKRFLASTAGALIVLSFGATAEAASTPKTYKNCTELNKKYAHGVGKKGAHDKIKGKVTSKSVKTFKVDDAAYKANKKMDGDNDGISCEKK